MTTCHHGDCGSKSDAEWPTSDDERNMEDMEVTELGPLLTSPVNSKESKVSAEKDVVAVCYCLSHAA